MLSTHSAYGQSLALLTDLYQLTMAYGYWKQHRADHEAVFHLYYRQNPFAGGFAIACGLGMVIDYVRSLRFDPSDIEYLRTLRGNDNGPLFDKDFLAFLADFECTCDVDAVPEGTVVFPQEPLVRVRGPLFQCQLLESPLLNFINFQTLVATKAARVSFAAGGEQVLEFGLRRAQGVDGSLSASRAAFIGGCAATSNVLAGKLFGIPVKGTHAHSWVMSFDTEQDAFGAYAEAMPNNCVFLVDTYDSLEGVQRAIEAGLALRQRGHEMAGIRLDSGDLAWLSARAREMLDAAGFPDAGIVASNDLDEHLIKSLKEQGAKIAVWGVGTKLATAYDQPALGGVYKLSAIRQNGGPWRHTLKLSEQTLKVSNPGVLQVRRFALDDEYIGDMIFDELTGVSGTRLVDPFDVTRQKAIPDGAQSHDLLEPVFRGGKLVADPKPIDEIRRFATDHLARFHHGIRRFENPHEYPVGLEPELHTLKTRLVREARGTGE